jgi:hypothetical protein
MDNNNNIIIDDIFSFLNLNCAIFTNKKNNYLLIQINNLFK